MQKSMVMDKITESGIEIGDILLFKYPSGVLPRMIAHVQKELLLDLDYTEDMANWASRFTHVGMYGNEVIDSDGQVVAGSGCILEMTSPRARFGKWEDVPDGTTILVRRPGCFIGSRWRDATSFQRIMSAQFAISDIMDGIPYPYTELLSYWAWHLWLGKLKIGRKFRRLFQDEHRDVCSGSVWRWMYSTGMFKDTAGMADSLPEAWYPGRLAADRKRFRTVTHFHFDKKGY